MSSTITIFDQEITLETMRVEIVAINDGFSVTAQAVLDGDDVLCAVTVARPRATFSEASTEMVGEAVALVRQWIEAHAVAEPSDSEAARG